MAQINPVERYSVREWIPPWLKHQHLERYRWVAPLLRGLRVADAACGTGYGSSMLANSGTKSVVGYDLSDETIREAAATFQGDRLDFRVADVTRLPVASGEFDAYVSFETLEHVPEPGALLSEARRVLRPGGTFICSTPNREMTNPGLDLRGKPYNRHHFREYLPDEFLDELRPHFSSVELWCQTLYTDWYARILASIGRVTNMASVRLHQSVKVLGIPWESRLKHLPRPFRVADHPEVLIAVCRA